MTDATAAIPAQPLRAAILVIAAMALIGLIDNYIAAIAREGSLWQFHLVRATLALAMLLPAGRVLGLPVRPLRVWAVGLRGALVAVSMLFYFGALAFLSVPEAASGLFAAPLIVLFATAFVLRQKVSAWNVAAALVGFAGVLMVLRPDLSGGAGRSALVQLLPMAAALFYAGGALATRTVCAGESTLSLLVAFFASLWILGLAGCAVLALWPVAAPEGAAGFVLRGWQPMSGTVLGLTAVQAVGSVIGVGLITRGYQLAEASFVSVFEYSILIFGAAWGWALWGQRLDPLAQGGIALIIASGLILARSRRRPAAGARPAGVGA